MLISWIIMIVNHWNGHYPSTHLSGGAGLLRLVTSVSHLEVEGIYRYLIQRCKAQAKRYGKPDPNNGKPLLPGSGCYHLRRCLRLRLVAPRGT